MKNNLLDKAIRLILGIVSILPQKRSGTAKSDTKTPATAAFSKALPQADKNLKPEATKAVSSAEPQKSSKTIPTIPTEAVKEEKSKDYISEKDTPKDPKDSLETKTSPDGKKEEVNKETEKNNIFRQDLIKDKTSVTTAIPLSSLGYQFSFSIA